MTVKCKYCGKIIGDITDTCPMCGAPVPKIVPQPEKEAAPPKTKASIIVTGLVIVFAIIALVAILEMSDRESREAWRESHTAWQESHTAWQEQRMSNAPIQQVPGNAPTATGGDTLADAHRQPNEVITDPGLRQALELVFRREMRQIGWDDVHSIRTFGVTQAYTTMSQQMIPLSEFENSPYAIRVHTDSPSMDIRQLWHFENLEVFNVEGSIASYALERLPNLREVSVRASANTPDLTHFSTLQNLQRLEIAGSNLTSLEGLSDLDSLHALRLMATGLQDLSVLSFQRNITELELISNSNISSFNSLQEMTWLRSLHIERSAEISFEFISNMTNLECLTIERTDTRTYDFITPLTGLRRLRLVNNREVASIPGLSEFTLLEELYMDRVGSAGFLEGLTSPTKLTLYGIESLESLRQMHHLRELNISLGWNFTDASPLGALSNLETLSINESRTSQPPRNMDAIGQLANLRRLDISSNSVWFNYDFIYRLTSLEELDISRNTVVGDFTGIRNLTELRVLNMDRVRLVPSFTRTASGGIESISYPPPTPADQFAESLTALTALEVLSMSGNNIQEISFVAHMPNLRQLNLENNYISDISPLAELTQLEYVDLRRNVVTNWNVVDELINTTFLGR